MTWVTSVLRALNTNLSRSVCFSHFPRDVPLRVFTLDMASYLQIETRDEFDLCEVLRASIWSIWRKPLCVDCGNANCQIPTGRNKWQAIKTSLRLTYTLLSYGYHTTVEVMLLELTWNKFKKYLLDDYWFCLLCVCVGVNLLIKSSVWQFCWWFDWKRSKTTTAQTT